MIQVLIVEDSAVVRDFLVYILTSDPKIQVVGTARNGDDALELLKRLEPDVITMDIHMPGMNGLEATRRIMETCPKPIVIVSESISATEITATLGAIKAGAVTAVPRPDSLGHPNHARSAKTLIQTVKAMADVKVVRRWPGRAPGTSTTRCQPEMPGELKPVKVITIGASTGGPAALQELINRLEPHFPVPILVVQHMASGFMDGLLQWLAQSCPLIVLLAVHGQRVQAGHVYFAPDGFHMAIDSTLQILLNKDEPENGLRPSVSCLFRSAGQAFGDRVVGVLLTGMGKDGAAELKMMKDKGAVTIIQDSESSAVYGMPGEAARLDAACYVLPPEQIANALNRLARRSL